MRFEFIVYGKPVPKGRPRFFVRKGFVSTYTPQETKKAENTVGKSAKLAGVKCIGKGVPVAIKMKFVMPIPKSFSKKKREDAISGKLKCTTKPDIDNLAKIIDGLNKIAWEDDSQIVSATFEKVYGEEPRTEFVIEEIE